MTFTQCWCHYNETTEDTGASQANYTESMNFVFANCSKKNSIYLLTTRKRVELQANNAQLAKLTTSDGYTAQLVEKIQVLCKDGKVIIPKDLQD